MQNMNLLKHVWGAGLVLSSILVSDISAKETPADAERFQRSVARAGDLGPIDGGRIFTRDLDGVDKVIIHQIEPESRDSLAGRDIRMQIPVKTVLGYKADHPLISAKYRVAGDKELNGGAARQIISAWKSQDIRCRGEQKECGFQPSYAIEFFSQGHLVLETYICFHCQTFVATAAGGHTGICELEPSDGGPKKLYDKLNEVMGVSAPKPHPLHAPKAPLDAIEPRWESGNADKAFTRWERDSIREHVHSLVHYCAAHLKRTQDRQDLDIPQTSVHFTIADKTPHASQAQANPRDNVLASPVSDIVVQSSPVDKALDTCVEGLVAKLLFLKSPQGPLQLGIQIPGHGSHP